MNFVWETLYMHIISFFRIITQEVILNAIDSVADMRNIKLRYA